MRLNLPALVPLPMAKILPASLTLSLPWHIFNIAFITFECIRQDIEQNISTAFFGRKFCQGS